MKKIAVVQIALGEQYYDFWQQSINRNKRHFFLNENVDFFLFTNYKKFAKSIDSVFVEEVEEEKWPFINYLKYLYLLKVLEKFQGYDYIFYLDSDNVIESPVPKEILEKELVMLRVTSWGAKYAGCFFGGEISKVKLFCEYIKPEIEKIFNAESFPARENDESLLEKVDDLPINVFLYNFDSVFSWFIHGNKFSEKWISQYEKDFVKSHNYNTYWKFRKLEGNCIFDLKRKLVSVFDWKSYSHYGRLIYMKDNEYLIRWENPSFGEDKIYLKNENRD